MYTKHVSEEFASIYLFYNYIGLLKENVFIALKFVFGLFYLF